MPRGPQYTEQQENYVMMLYKRGGFSTKQIAEICGIRAENSVYSIIRRHTQSTESAPFKPATGRDMIHVPKKGTKRRITVIVEVSDSVTYLDALAKIQSHKDVEVIETIRAVRIVPRQSG